MKSIKSIVLFVLLISNIFTADFLSDNSKINNIIKPLAEKVFNRYEKVVEYNNQNGIQMGPNGNNQQMNNQMGPNNNNNQQINGQMGPNNNNNQQMRPNNNEQMRPNNDRLPPNGEFNPEDIPEFDTEFPPEHDFPEHMKLPPEHNQFPPQFDGEFIPPEFNGEFPPEHPKDLPEFDGEFIPPEFNGEFPPEHPRDNNRFPQPEENINDIPSESEE